MPLSHGGARVVADAASVGSDAGSIRHDLFGVRAR